MTAVVFIITWEIIRKPTWHWKKPRVRVEWTAICTWGKLMLPPEIIIMPPVCTAITCPSRDRMRRSIINWDYASWRKGLPEGVGSISGRKTDRREQPDADLILQRDRSIRISAGLSESSSTVKGLLTKLPGRPDGHPGTAVFIYEVEEQSSAFCRNCRSSI